MRVFHPSGPTFWELARQALSSTEQGYDLLAPKFDLTPFRTPDEILRGARGYLSEEPPRCALDLCCGTGAVMEVLKPLARELVVGLDISLGMLRVAKHTGSPLVRANTLAPPFASAFDLVTCFSALGHILPSEQRMFVRAVEGCLRPEGRFVFVTGEMPSVWSRGYWLSRGFNAAMHVRNALWSPEFIMYYLTFLLPEAEALLVEEGFRVRVERRRFESPFEGFALVDARKA